MNEKPNRLSLQQIREIFITNAKEFCTNTTLHGLLYLRKRDLYLSEKFYFVGSMVMGCLLASYFTFNTYWKWSTSSPVIVSIKPELTLITDHPFPAVTICNLNQVYKSRAEQFAINSTEYTKVQLLCKNKVDGSANITDWNDLNVFIRDTSQPCANMLLYCSFGGVKFKCDEIFHYIITDEGLCCAFNMEHPYFMFHSNVARHTPLKEVYTDGLMPVDWTIQKGYPKDLPPKFYPQKAVGTGASLGLTLVLDVEADQYYCSSMNHIGFKMALHNPTEMPKAKEEGLLVSPGYETKAPIKVEKTEAEEELRDINVRHRLCYFEDEYRLKIFMAYTERNCQAECVATMVNASCGCIRHYMPKIMDNATICTIEEVGCVERAQLRSLIVKDNRTDCSDFCLPSCSDATYTTDFSALPLSHKGFLVNNEAVQNLSDSYVKNNIAVLHIYFQSMSYHTLKLTELVNDTEFLSNVGGILCLFMGFSFITIAELVFYGLMRPSRMLWTYRKKAETQLSVGSNSNRWRRTKDRLFTHNLSKTQQFAKYRHMFSKRKLNIVQDYKSTELFCTIAEMVHQRNLEKMADNNDALNLQWID